MNLFVFRTVKYAIEKRSFIFSSIFITLLNNTSCLFIKKNTKYFSLIQEKKTVSSNKIIRDLSLFPLNSQRFRLSELKNIKAIVITMRLDNCPISREYGFHLTYLEKKYSKKGILFIYNYVGQIEKEENSREDLKKFGFKGPYIIDSRGIIIDALDVKTTGEIVVLTPSRQIIYKGPLNDQYHSLKSTPQPRKYYLVNTLKAIVSGKSITQKNIPAFGTTVDRPMVKKKIFWNNVAPIIQKKCTICHNPFGNGPINYLNYEDVTGRQAMFRYVIENNLMPPWFVDPNTGPWNNDLSLTPKEKALLLKWIADGTPKRSKKTQILWTKKTKLNTTPDYIIHLPEQVSISPEKILKYKKFVISTNFKKDKWIKSVKFHLKPKVIHHVFLYVMDTSFDPLKGIPSNILKYASTVFSEGASQTSNRRTVIANKEIGYKLPRGSQLILEIHYEPRGQKITDDFTEIHINFSKKKPKYKIVTYTIAASNIRINIPPHTSNYKIKTSYKTKEQMTLVKVHPHMHLRGKANSIFITNPKGERRRIFGIDPFMINFETTYTLKSPLVISKGSLLECINWFDNSEENPVNPNPNKNVLYGPFETNEMSLCHFRWLVPIDSKIRNQWIKIP